MAGHQSASGQVSVNSAFTWSLLLCNWYQVCVCSLHMRVLRHHYVHVYDMSTIIAFVYFGLQVKWNQCSANNSHHTSCIHKGLHAGKWPDLMTSKPDSVSTLGYHWTDHTWRPLEPQVHWDATGSTLADASTQWCSSVNLHNWNTLEDHWSHKYTGMPLEPRWLILAPRPSGVSVATQR